MNNICIISFYKFVTILDLEKLKIQKCHAETFKAHSDQTWIAYKIIALSGPSIKNYILFN